MGSPFGASNGSARALCSGTCDEEGQAGGEGREGDEEGQAHLEDREGPLREGAGLPWEQGEDGWRPEEGIAHEEQAGEDRVEARQRTRQAGLQADRGLGRGAHGGAQRDGGVRLAPAQREDAAGQGALREDEDDPGSHALRPLRTEWPEHGSCTSVCAPSMSPSLGLHVGGRLLPWSCHGGASYNSTVIGGALRESRSN